MIHLEGVEKSYNGSRVLKGIDLDIRKGEFLAVMGHSGSGKSTLLNLIGGVDRPDRGRITVDRQEITAWADPELTLYRRTRVGFIFQFFNLFPHLTVRENVEMPLLLNGREDDRAVRETLERVGLSGREKSFPHELSGGEQQRVAVARALIHQPCLILADEPTGSLDSRMGETIVSLIRSLAKDEGRTVVLVTHNETVAAHADRTVRMRDGMIFP
jgi:putative ABC transport system ATP-binding protein